MRKTALFMWIALVGCSQGEVASGELAVSVDTTNLRFKDGAGQHARPPVGRGQIPAGLGEVSLRPKFSVTGATPVDFIYEQELDDPRWELHATLVTTHFTANPQTPYSVDVTLLPREAKPGDRRTLVMRARDPVTRRLLAEARVGFDVVEPHWISSDRIAASSLWASGETDLYAVGGKGIFHSPGSSWSAQASGVTDDLTAVFGTGREDIYVATRAGRILHSFGDYRWSVEDTGQTEPLWGLGGVPGDVYAVGEKGTILRSTGDGIWELQESGTESTLTAVWRGARDIYAVGLDGVILRSSGDGSWRREESGSTSTLQGVWGNHAGEIWVTGRALLRSTGDGAWVPETAPESALAVAMWGRGDDVYAVGMSGSVIHRGADRVWRFETATTTANLSSVFGVGDRLLAAAGPWGILERR